MRKSLKNFKTEKTVEQKAEEIMSEYGNMSEDALFAKLMEEVSASKSNGTFDAAALEKQLSGMLPYLNEAQKARLNHLMKIIGS